jgi:hypothetical protein
MEEKGIGKAQQRFIAPISALIFLRGLRVLCGEIVL